MLRAIASLVCAVFLFQAGCASAEVPVPSQSTTAYGTRVFTSDRCIFDSARISDSRFAFVGAIASAVLPALVETSLKRFSAAIRKAGEKSTTSITGTNNVEIDTKTLPVCMQIIQGNFHLKKTLFTLQNFRGKGILPSLPNEEAAFGILNDSGAYIADPPLMFFEGYVRKSGDGTAIALGPTALVYNGLLESEKGNPKNGTRDLVFSFAIGGPGSAGAQDKGTIGQIEFPNIPTKTFRVYDGQGPETPWIPIQLTENKAPRSVTITASETKNANQFLLFLAEVLDGSKEEVETVLKQTLIESERIKVKQQQLAAEKDKQAAEVKTLADAVDAEAQARIALLDYQAAVTSNKSKAELIVKATDAFKKMLDANLKANHAGLAHPFSNSILGATQAVIRS